ncbi:MerR family transcriptional regulator [Streptomyces sp. TS71-3]|uniref:MerR family transcriptional regulator n=1 Tax=Streptomyces sp. TS71-3 TaxID=2733862 RepID=UPI001B0238AD|nr:MerR family transcriptional regulator [Streptomyces sp. TS71-3]GHJ39682.1 MerR family transcriptional regulator [Streptomyces sp. TS71-3]
MPDAEPDPGPHPGHGPDPDPAAGAREYRTEELARAAGITVRTLRFYRERKLLPPPRREGRLAWYNDRHLARLRTITALLDRGHTLTGIAELAEAFDHGRGVGELLGLGTPTEEIPVRLTPEELADRFAGQDTAENLAKALELGYLGTDGQEIVHVSRRLLDASSALVHRGVPLAEVLEAGHRVRAHTDALAELFTDMVGRYAPDEDPESLRPLAKTIVEAELSLALDRRTASGPTEPGQATGS